MSLKDVLDNISRFEDYRAAAKERGNTQKEHYYDNILKDLEKKRNKLAGDAPDGERAAMKVQIKELKEKIKTLEKKVEKLTPKPEKRVIVDKTGIKPDNKHEGMKKCHMCGRWFKNLGIHQVRCREIHK